MKNLKKILVLVLMIAALCVSVVLGVTAEDEYTGTVEELNAKIGVAVSAADDTARYNALVTVAAYLPTVDPEAEGYADAVKTANEQATANAKALLTAAASATDLDSTTGSNATLGKRAALDMAVKLTELFTLEDADVASGIKTEALACAELYLAAIADTEVESTARNQIAVNNLNAFIKLGLCDEESEEYKALLVDFEARMALQAEAKEAARQAMMNNTALTDYDLGVLLDNDFDDGTNSFPAPINKGSNFAGVENGRYTITYGAKDTSNTYIQYTFPVNSGSNATSNKGIVVDFDLTTFSTLPPAFHLEGGGHSGLGNGDKSKVSDTLNGYPKIYASYFKVYANGNVAIGDCDDNLYDGSEVVLTNAVTTGEWMHYTCIYDPASFTYSLYCEYELLATYTGLRYGFSYILSAARFAASTQETSEWSIDNVQIYQGTSLRDIGIFERMNTEQTFVYYANYYTNDETADTIGRYTAYNEVMSRLSTYVDEDGNFLPFEQADGMSDEEYAALTEQVKQAISDVKSYDHSAFLERMKVANTDTLAKYVEQLKAINRNLTNDSISARSLAISKIESFLASANDIFELTEEYETAEREYLEYRKQCLMDENILEFNDCMLRYSRVETLNSLQKYYNRAYEVFNDSEAPIDPAVAELEGFEEFAKYYEMYSAAVERMRSVERDNNAKKIIGCYELISVFSPDEWDANYDYINPYVIMIRQTIKDDYYNYDYEGVDKAISGFEAMDEYFYGLLQAVHIAEISERLDYVYNNDAYVEKMGTLSYIERYLASNDIDYTNETIAQLLINYETALDELAFREVDYETVLRQNASYFISLVEKMRISSDFNEKRELYDQAIGFYFALDANVEGAREAIAVFDEHTLWFEKGEQSSVLFLEAVAVLQSAATEDEKYAALVNCYVYSLDAELTYDGVEAAMAIFNAEHEAYNAEVGVANEAIDSAGITVGAVRANCGVGSIIAVIVKKLFD